MISSSDEYKKAIIAKSRRTYIRALVDISDPDIQYGDVLMDSEAPWNKPEDLIDKVFDAPARYATLEFNRWKLDGSFDIFPDDFEVPQHMGATNNNLSKEDGTFEIPSVIKLNFESVGVLQALSFYFSTDPLDGIPENFTVEVLVDNVPYYTKQFSKNADSEISIEGFTVYTPDAVRLTVTKWSKKIRRMRVMDIVLGLSEQWSGSMLASFEASHNCDFSCITIPYGTVKIAIDNRSKRFEPRNKNGIFQSIEARQGIEIYVGVKLSSGSIDYKMIGMFYQHDDGWKTGDNGITIQWDLCDIVGLLSTRTFIPPETLPKTLEGWIKSVVTQLGENFSENYHVDPNYSSKSVIANSVDDVTGKKCGDIIRWACMATGTWPRADAETGYLTAEPLWDQGNKITLNNMVGYPTMKANKSIAALIFHLADENQTEYVVSGNSTSSETTITIENPFIHSKDQALTAARLILSCYGGNTFEIIGRGDPSSEIGDVDTIWLDESQATTARRMMQTFSITDGVLQGCQSKLLQADGSYLFQEFAVIRESGKWKAPANVKNNQLRVVIGSGGQGGSRGHDGFVSGSGNIPGAGVTSGYGEDGIDGQGGRVWYGVININLEQEFNVVLGAGGAASDVAGVPGEMGGVTTFGAYSSANGELYDVGYTDIANGQSFARTGVEAPLDGTGDGGKGGKGGDPGEGYWKQQFWSDGRPKGWDFIITKEPGPGHPGVDGASGFVMVTWDKEDAEL